MQDCIVINELTLSTVIGIEAWEQALPQKLMLSLEIGIANAKVFSSDDINDAIDYAKVVARLTEMAQAQRFALVEAFAEAAAKLVIDEFKAPWVTLVVKKPAILPGVKEVGVRIRRQMSGIRDQ